MTSSNAQAERQIMNKEKEEEEKNNTKKGIIRRPQS